MEGPLYLYHVNYIKKIITMVYKKNHNVAMNHVKMLTAKIKFVDIQILYPFKAKSVNS